MFEYQAKQLFGIVFSFPILLFHPVDITHCLFISRYTSKMGTSGNVVYAILLKWPSGSVLKLGAPVVTPQTRVTLLGYNGPAFAYQGIPGGGITIQIPIIPFNQMPCNWGWVFKLEGLSNNKTVLPSTDSLMKKLYSL